MAEVPTARHTEPFDVTVVGIRAESADVVSLTLSRTNGEELPPWEPGAHIDFLMAPALERQYSLCGEPADRQQWRIAVLREPESRGGSRWVHEELRAGDVVGVRGPHNNFALVEQPEYLFIAGGVGITPLMPMISRCETAGARWRLVYGGRTADSMAFTEELGAYGDRVTFWPEDRCGLIDLPTLLGEPRGDVAVYCCGPEQLLAAVEERCSHWPPGALHVERFRPRAGALDGSNTAFEVELDSTGVVLTVAAAESILDALDAAGVHVPTSCREGTCGTCETVVLDGLPDHRDSFLTDAERASNEVMIVCCSRSLSSRLVLDI